MCLRVLILIKHILSWCNRDLLIGFIFNVPKYVSIADINGYGDSLKISVGHASYANGISIYPQPTKRYEW